MFWTRRATAPDLAPDLAAKEGDSATGLSRVAVIDDESFMDDTEGGYTIVDFWAQWCAPCHAFAPIFRAVADAHDGPVRFGQCDVDASPRTAELLQIRSIPTLVVFGPDGSEVTRVSGVVPPRQLAAMVADLATRAPGAAP